MPPPLEPRFASCNLRRCKAGEVAKIRARNSHDVTAGTAVTAVGPALRDVLLPPEAERTVAAAPGLDPDARAIVEH